MKVSLALISGLLTIANASPTPRDVNILLDIKVEENSLVTPQQNSHVLANQDICWRACFSEEPSCPPGWNSKELGDCWTCCKSLEDAIVAETLKGGQKFVEAAPSKDIFSDICYKICAPVELKCAEGWESRQFGDCWTCCKSDDDAVAKTLKKAQKFVEAAPSQKVFTSEDPCWKVCWDQETPCPSKWYSKQFGDCWTCCLKLDNDFVAEL